MDQVMEGANKCLHMRASAPLTVGIAKMTYDG